MLVAIKNVWYCPECGQKYEILYPIPRNYLNYLCPSSYCNLSDHEKESIYCAPVIKKIEKKEILCD